MRTELTPTRSEYLQHKLITGQNTIKGSIETLAREIVEDTAITFDELWDCFWNGDEIPSSKVQIFGRDIFIIDVIDPRALLSYQQSVKAEQPVHSFIASKIAKDMQRQITLMNRQSNRPLEQVA